jgi:CRP-like cAMP-binding protein
MPDLIKFIKSKIIQEKSDSIKILEQIPIFEGLSTVELKKIEIITHERSYIPDEIVFHEKEPGAGMYIIKKGLIALTKKKKETEIEVAKLKEKEFFGELALLDESPRSATATASEKTELLGFYRPDFLELLEREPKLGSKVLLKLSQILASRLRHTTETSVQGASFETKT